MSPRKPIRETHQQLTRAEDEVMQILWDLKKGFVNDVLARCPDPKPAYNTISTIIRILEQKGFIGHKAYGRTYEYYPLVERNAYTRSYFRNFVSHYFGNSYRSLASFFTRDENLSLKELEEISKIINTEIDKQKKRRS